MPGIRQRIALDGAPEFLAGLGEIGKAGAEVFAGLRAAAKDLGLDKELTPQFDRAKKSASDFGDGFKKAFKGLGDVVQDVANASAKITASLAGAGAALFALSASAAKTAHEIEQSALRTGQTADEYQKLGFGFKETGVEANELTRAFAKISQEASQAAREGKQSTGAWEKYGIALRGADGHARSITAILSDVADKMASITNPTERAGIAAELFGARVGTKMVGLLSQGSAGMRAMAEDAERLGIVIGEHDLAAGTALERGLVRLGGTLDATRTKVGLAFAPAFTTAVNAFADAFGKLQPAIVDVANAIANTLAPYIKDLAAILTGNAQQIQTGFFSVLYAAFTGLAGLVNSVLVPAVRGWVVILQQAGTIIDSVLGQGMTAKLLSGAAGAVALAVAFGTLLKSVQLLAGGLGIVLRLVGLGASLSPVSLAIIAIAAAIGLLIVALEKVDWAKFAAAAKETWDSIVAKVQEVIGKITDFFTGWFNWFIDKINAAANAFARLTGGGGPTASPEVTPGGAAGGYVRGPGTATSDSISARLSRGEYVHKAAAVSHYGVSFMHAINSMKFPRFALGGLVDRITVMPAPVRFASGGLAQSGSRFDLTIDGNRFPNLRAPADTAVDLRSYAVRRQMASGGRAPSWVK